DRRQSSARAGPGRGESRLLQAQGTLTTRRRRARGQRFRTSGIAESARDASMPDARAVYRDQAEVYDTLVRCEDKDGRLLPAVRAIRSLDGADVVELGAGTGRVTTLLAPHVRSIRAFDAEQAMLDVARRHLVRSGGRNWELAVADNTSLP